jgi:c-di-GMP-binding flagellar brake protein YcgR
VPLYLAPCLPPDHTFKETTGLVSAQLDKIPETPTAELDDSRYRVHSRVEVASVLRAIMNAGALITAYFGHGKDFVVTAILGVDAEHGRVVVDSGSNAQVNERLLRDQQLTLVSTQDGVKVEFHVEHVEATTFEGRMAFQIPFPDSLLKLQRREYYRLLAPLLHPLKCQIPLAVPGGANAVAGNNRVVETTVADISLGGVSLMGEHLGLKLEVGQLFEGCRIVLPEVGTITAKLAVRNSFPVTLKNGTVTRRTGCAFVDLPPSQEAVIQRYINKLERERRTKVDPKS